MLGIAALAELAFAELPSSTVSTTVTGPPWRRLAAQRHPGSKLNVGPPDAILRRMRDEEDVMILLATLQ
jgi:hypothetical protein